MQPFQQVGLLASVVLYLNSASVAATSDNEANLGIWDIDSSCTNYHVADQNRLDVSGETGGPDLSNDLRKQLSNSIEITAYALTRLNYIRGERPSEPAAKAEWNRIADAAGVVLGIVADPGKNQKKSIFKPSTKAQWQKATDAYTKVSTTLPAAHNDPIRGYGRNRYEHANMKPMFVCGDNWKWYNFNDTTKYPGQNTYMTQHGFIRMAMTGGAVGGWFKGGLFVAKKVRLERPIMCINGVGGFANAAANMVGMCDKLLKDESTRSGTLKYNTPKEGEHIDMYIESFQGVLLNQLFKWYGGLEKGTNVLAVTDQQAVTSEGLLRYMKGTTEEHKTKILDAKEAAADNMIPILATTYASVANLAMIHDDAQAKYAGPQMAGINPTSLTAFALMMWFRGYVWVGEGVAAPFDKPPDYDGPPSYEPPDNEGPPSYETRGIDDRSAVMELSA